jgi:pyridoxal phosphate-dependent aminotransferase EpsN
MHLQPVFTGATVYGGRVSEKLFASGLCLPSGAGLTHSEVEQIACVIKETLLASQG